MTEETRMVVVEHDVRWASNMLNEVMANHGRILTKEQREALKTAQAGFAEFRANSR
jgi:ABC-type polar amino acid transport system ATPase subunit